MREVADARYGPSANDAVAAQTRINTADAAANARCNVRITLLPNEFGRALPHANAVPAGG